MKTKIVMIMWRVMQAVDMHWISLVPLACPRK